VVQYLFLLATAVSNLFIQQIMLDARESQMKFLKDLQSSEEDRTQGSRQ
jgi:hypothetical protein